MENEFGKTHNSIDIINDFLTGHDEFLIVGSNNLGVKVQKFLLENVQKQFKHINVELEEIDLLDESIGDKKLIIASYDEVYIAKKLFEKFNFIYGVDYIFYDHLLNQDYMDRNCIGAQFVDFFVEHKSKFLSVFEILSDDYSKKMYKKVLNFRSNLLNIENIDSNDLPTTLEEKRAFEQNSKKFLKFTSLIDDSNLANDIAFKISLNPYTYKDIVSPKNKQSILDLGAYNNTATMFSYYSPEGQVYAFEPQLEIHNQNITLSTLYKNIIPINYGAWSESGTVSFNISDEQTTASSISEDGAITINVVSIDDFCKSNNLENVDFIKMDIEGAEVNALLGASNVIQKYKPDLAISIYHKAEHLFEIPLLIKEILPEYNIYIDHKYFSYSKTICFATIR